QPPVAVTHYAFQIMVGIGSLLVLISLGYFFLLMRKKSILERKWLLKLFVLAIPLGYIALEAGWIVTEVGRQPWIIYGIMRTRDAVTPMPGIAWSFYLFSAIYASLNVIVIFLLYRQIKMVPVLYTQPDGSTLAKAD
ncbi:MAG: cytochrome ubiquinol oxidase subunit I, partial [Pedobacter sp.]